MITYMTRQMIAQQAMTYASQDLQPGDTFFATPDDERYFTRSGRARPAGPQPAPRQFVPVAAPIGETNTVVAVLVQDTATPATAPAPAKDVAAAGAEPAAPDTAAQTTAQTAADKPSGDEVAQTAPSAAERPAPATRGRNRQPAPTGEASN